MKSVQRIVKACLEIPMPNLPVKSNRPLYTRRKFVRQNDKRTHAHADQKPAEYYKPEKCWMSSICSRQADVTDSRIYKIATHFRLNTVIAESIGVTYLVVKQMFFL
jgi:hypothetical protein